MIGTLFFMAWRQVVKGAGGAAVLPGLRWLIPERWRQKLIDAADKEIGKVGK